MSTPEAEARALSERKARHLEICLDGDKYRVESRRASWDNLRFLHRALPELDFSELGTSRNFLGRAVKLPFFISCMTGGSTEAFRLNKELAKTAQEACIAVGMGSHRVLFRDPDVFAHFHLRKIAPDVPILSNLGGVLVRDMDLSAIVEMNKRLEVDAQVIHCNQGQELFQDDGDRDFRGVLAAVKRLAEKSPIPVIVKETGFGFSPGEVKSLLDAGAAYVDLAGAGGTNWLAVESYRVESVPSSAADPFLDWGQSTAVLLDALPRRKAKILASGGVRSGLDVAKAVSLGAHLAGLALPFARAVSEGGSEGGMTLVRTLSHQLKTAMLLAGAKDLDSLARVPLYRTREFQDEVRFLKKRGGAG